MARCALNLIKLLDIMILSEMRRFGASQAFRPRLLEERSSGSVGGGVALKAMFV